MRNITRSTALRGVAALGLRKEGAAMLDHLIRKADWKAKPPVVTFHTPSVSEALGITRQTAWRWRTKLQNAGLIDLNGETASLAPYAETLAAPKPKPRAKAKPAPQPPDTAARKAKPKLTLVATEPKKAARLKRIFPDTPPPKIEEPAHMAQYVVEYRRWVHHYPGGIGSHKNAERYFRRAVTPDAKGRAMLETLMDCAKRIAEETEHREDQRQYLPDAQRFLYDRKWEDIEAILERLRSKPIRYTGGQNRGHRPPINKNSIAG